MPNENRELATIQEIKKITPIENADKLEKAKVLEWEVVVRKGEDFLIFFFLLKSKFKIKR